MYPAPTRGTLLPSADPQNARPSNIVHWAVRVAENVIGRIPQARDVAIDVLDAAAGMTQLMTLGRNELLSALRTAIRHEATRVFVEIRQSSVGAVSACEDTGEATWAYCRRNGNALSQCVPMWARVWHFIDVQGMSVDRVAWLMQSSCEDVARLLDFARRAYALAA